jgi:arylsulfatase A-like enzyme
MDKIKAYGLLFGLLLIVSCKQGIEEVQQPNLVIVFPDQMRGQAMGFTGEEPVMTPRLDQFANEGIVFDQAVSNSPVCSPFRAMFMTGKYPQSNHVMSNCTSRTAVYDNELQTSDTTWSDLLNERGYSLGYIGKWHLDAPYEPYVDCANNKGDLAWNEWCPPERRHGFDFWYAYGTYDYHDRPMYWSTDAGRNDFHYVDQWGPEHEADLAIKYIQNKDGSYRNSDKPFALVVSMNPPHMPYDRVPEKYKDMYRDADTTSLFSRPNIPPSGTEWGDYYRKNIRNYYAMITGVDFQFGRILDALKQAGLDENTIVLFTSDHGNCLGIHDKISKSNPYEESMRVPFILRWNGKLKPHHEDLLISSPDIYPTLIDLMGLGEYIPSGVEGTSYAGNLLNGKGPLPSSQLYLMGTRVSAKSRTRGVRTSRYTLVINKRSGQPGDTILYDRHTDPYQLINTAALNSEIVNSLIRSELEPSLTKLNDPFCIE